MQPEVEITDCSFCPSAPVSQNHVLSFLPAGRSKPDPCSQRASPHGESQDAAPLLQSARSHSEQQEGLTGIQDVTLAPQHAISF